MRPAPAPGSRSTVRSRWARRCTASGVSATRCSPGARSVGTPTIIAGYATAAVSSSSHADRPPFAAHTTGKKDSSISSVSRLR